MKFVLKSLQVSKIPTSLEFVKNIDFLNPVGFLKRGGEMWEPSAPSLPSIGCNKHRWFKCAEKGKREVEVTEPREAAKKKKKRKLPQLMCKLNRINIAKLIE